MDPRPILLVEDNPDDEALTIRSLKKANIQNEIVVARDGVEALDRLFATGALEGQAPLEPVVVLLDLKLPKVDGLEVLERVRQDSRTSRLPVVVLTSSREQEDVIRSYELYANSYIRKPVGFDAFADVVSHLGLYWALFNEPPPQTGS